MEGVVSGPIVDERITTRVYEDDQQISERVEEKRTLPPSEGEQHLWHEGRDASPEEREVLANSKQAMVVEEERRTSGGDVVTTTTLITQQVIPPVSEEETTEAASVHFTPESSHVGGEEGERYSISSGTRAESTSETRELPFVHEAAPPSEFSEPDQREPSVSGEVASVRSSGREPSAERDSPLSAGQWLSIYESLRASQSPIPPPILPIASSTIVVVITPARYFRLGDCPRRGGGRELVRRRASRHRP